MGSCEFKILPSSCIWYMHAWLVLISWLWVSNWQVHSSQNADWDLLNTESLWETTCPWLIHSKKSGSKGHGREKVRISFSLLLLSTLSSEEHHTCTELSLWALRPEDTISQVRHHTVCDVQMFPFNGL